MLDSSRDPREAKVLVWSECGILIVMFCLQVVVLVLSCGIHRCWVRGYEGWEEEREKMERKRSIRIDEESMVNLAKISEVQAKKLDEKVKTQSKFNGNGNQWVKNDFEG